MNYEIMKKEATTQYNEWLGTIALDNTNKQNLQDFFNKKINHEKIIGIEIEMNSTEGIEVKTAGLYLKIYTEIDNKNKRDKEQPSVKLYKTLLGIEDFFKLFKRINICFFSKDKEIVIVQEENI